MAPGRMWVRPRAHIYCENYNFGSNLYSEALEALNKKHFPHFSSNLVFKEKRPESVVGNGLFQELPASESDKRTRHTTSLQRSLTTIFNKPQVSRSSLYPTFDASYIGQDAVSERLLPTKQHQMQEKHRQRRQVRSFHEAHLRYLEDRHGAFQCEVEQEAREREEQEVHKRTVFPVSLEKNLHNLEIMTEEELSKLPNESKENQLKIEQLTQRLKETESKLKTEVVRVKKQFQLQMGELEMSLDSANKQNIDLQKTTKKQNLQMTELKSHYEDIHQKLQQTVDQLELCQRRCQTLQAELDETRASLDSAQRFKRTAEQSLEEAQSVIKELTTVNTRLTSDKANVENELSGLQADYDVLQKELRANEERATRAETDLRLTKDRLAQEQDRFLKMDSIKNALEMEVRNLQNRIEEVESSTLAGSKRVIAKLETRIRDLETDYEEQKRRNAETQKIIRKKEHRLKEQLLKTEEDHNTILNLKDCVENLSEKCKIYKRQLAEKEGMAQHNQARVRRFQRELESAEDRADLAEGNLSLIRIKHKTLIPPTQESGSILHG